MLKRTFTIFVFTLACISLTSAQETLETESFYNLRFLKQSSPPRYVKIVNISNIISNRSMMSKGIVFTYKSRRAKRVAIAGSFSRWQARPMIRGKHGVWFYYLDKFRGRESIRYKFNIDGTWTFDPNNMDKGDDQAGSYVSLIDPIIEREGTRVSYKLISKRRVQFRIYNPDARFISLVGDFNHWNPEHDLLRKGKDGIWRVTKRLTPGRHRYRYLIDGNAAVDLYNENSSSDDAGDLCSLIEIR